MSVVAGVNVWMMDMPLACVSHFGCGTWLRGTIAPLPSLQNGVYLNII